MFAFCGELTIQDSEIQSVMPFFSNNCICFFLSRPLSYDQPDLAQRARVGLLAVKVGSIELQKGGSNHGQKENCDGR
jgi:hypothetical protein